jgi:hypothetical protein
VAAATSDRIQLNAFVQSLSADERAILLSLRERGPGLPLEIAVRLLKMPEEVAQPLQHLSELGLVQANAVGDSVFGSNVLRLSDLGSQVVAILRDPARLSEIDAAPPAPQSQQALGLERSGLSYTKSTADPREREVELLQQLADLARQSGDLAKASEWLQQALAVQRTIAAK